MTRFALVKDQEILEWRDYPPNVDQTKLPKHKPRHLPVEVDKPEFDEVSQVCEGPVYVVKSTKVVEQYTVRDKNDDEVTAMIAEKDAVIEAEFLRRYCEPIEHEVGGETYTFHADSTARENITGVLDMYNEGDRMGMPLSDPRPWTPMGEEAPVMITRNELALLGIAIGARKDALYTIKKQKQAELAATTDPVVISNIDPLVGWEID